MAKQQYAKKWAKVVARAWTDDEFRNQLLQNSVSTLQAEGLSFDPDVKRIVILEDTPETKYLTLPCKPEGLIDPDVADDVVTRRCHSVPAEEEKK